MALKILQEGFKKTPIRLQEGYKKATRKLQEGSKKAPRRLQCQISWNMRKLCFD